MIPASRFNRSSHGATLAPWYQLGQIARLPIPLSMMYSSSRRQPSYTDTRVGCGG